MNILRAFIEINILGALFDLDGTLLDTEPLYDEAEQKIINLYGNGKPIEQSIKQQLLGTPANINCKLLVERYEVKLTPDEFQKMRDDLLIEPFRNSKFKPGAKELTHKCKIDYGLKTAIATGSSTFNFENKMYKLKEWQNKYIDVVVTSDNIKRGKPNPDIFIIAAKKLGLQPYECIVFEDGLPGVKAAISAGVRIVVAVIEEYQRQSFEELIYDKNRTTLIILKSLEEFDFSLIKKQN
jgi:pseudouridine-5'-monophosphatase